MIFNMGGGGSSGANAFATIAVKYSPGSVCTCTCGDVTLKAKNDYGLWAFHVPSAGTWTITASNESEGKSKSIAVAITTQGQTEYGELFYAVVIFDAGVVSPFTSWKTLNGYPSITNIIHTSSSSNDPADAYCVLPIDVTYYSKLSFTGISGIWYLYDIGSTRVGYVTSEPKANEFTAYTAMPSNISTSSGTVSLDLSNVTGKIYIHIWNMGTDDQYSSWMEITKIWIE